MRAPLTAQRNSDIASQRPARPAASQPFVTRRSTIVFSALCLVAGVLFQALAISNTSGSGATGMVEAFALAVTFVCAIVAWVCGVVLAARAGSRLWLVVAVLPFFPINSMMCAMFCPAARTDRRP